MRERLIRMHPSGTLIDPFNVRAEQIEINDIARHLSNICRFGGGVPGFYSVAEHSVAVAAMVGESYRKWALLHDAAEAYIGDVVRPLKEMTYLCVDFDTFLSYQKIEHRILHEISWRFGLHEQAKFGSNPIPDCVRIADDARCAEERKLIEEGKLYGNSPFLAEQQVLQAWREL